jgi:hypothetical protein
MSKEQRERVVGFFITKEKKNPGYAELKLQSWLQSGAIGLCDYILIIDSLTKKSDEH